MEEAKPGKPLWRHIAELTLWLCLAPPIGLWKLWADTTLSPAAKWRVLVYLFVVPALLYVTISVTMTSHALQGVMP